MKLRVRLEREREKGKLGKRTVERIVFFLRERGRGGIKEETHEKGKEISETTHIFGFNAVGWHNLHKNRWENTP